MFRDIGFNQTGCPLYFNRTRHGCLEGNGREKLQSVKLEANFSIPKLSEILAVIKKLTLKLYKMSGKPILQSSRQM